MSDLAARRKRITDGLADELEGQSCAVGNIYPRVLARRGFRPAGRDSLGALYRCRAHPELGLLRVQFGPAPGESTYGWPRFVFVDVGREVNVSTTIPEVLKRDKPCSATACAGGAS